MAERMRLPIRLVPRKRTHVILLIFFGLFFAFACFWMILAMQPGMRLEFNDVEVTDPFWRRIFPLWGVPFLLIGAGGLAVCLSRLLPRSPYFHVEVSAEGLRVREFGRPKHFAWRDLPAFETLEVVKRDDDGTTRNYYAVAMRPGLPSVPSTRSKKDPREIVRIPAHEYGVKDTMEDAQMLADWLNRVRDSASSRGSDDIEIPEALRKIAISAPAMSDRAQRAQTVVRR